MQYKGKSDALPPLRKKYVETITAEKSRTLSVCAYYTAVFAVRGEFPAVDTEKIDLDRDENGKPFFVLNNSKLNFSVSISHCGSACAAVVSKTPVGIDIENKNREINEKILPKVCCEQEILYLRNLTDAQKKTEFLKMWTKKEAASKVCGKGFTEGFRLFNTLRMRNTVCIEYKDEFISVAVSPEQTLIKP